MPQALAVAKRAVIIERHERGESLVKIGQELGLSYWTVRKIWRRYRDRGEAGLRPDYERCQQPGPRSEQVVYRGACWLKRAHPGWGAGLIRLLLMEKWPTKKVPHERTLQRWFRREGLHAVRQHRPTGPRQRGKEPHEVWQMDAKEHIKLADGQEVSWLLISDETSGAQLDATVFPPGCLDHGAGTGGASRVARELHPLGMSRTDTGG